MALDRRYQPVRGGDEAGFGGVIEGLGRAPKGLRLAGFEGRERGAQVLPDDASDREAAAHRHRRVAACADGTDDPVGGCGLELAGVAAQRQQLAGGIGERLRAGEQAPGGVEHDPGAHVGGQLVHVFERQRRRQGRRHRRRAEYGPVPLNRIAWLTTVGICLVISLILLISGYLGYAGVLLAIALSAAINLR
jgi:hypothetical protein